MHLIVLLIVADSLAVGQCLVDHSCVFPLKSGFVLEGLSRCGFRSRLKTIYSVSTHCVLQDYSLWPVLHLFRADNREWAIWDMWNKMVITRKLITAGITGKTALVCAFFPTFFQHRVGLSSFDKLVPKRESRPSGTRLKWFRNKVTQLFFIYKMENVRFSLV